jgi:hypothetical protein
MLGICCRQAVIDCIDLYPASARYRGLEAGMATFQQGQKLTLSKNP